MKHKLSIYVCCVALGQMILYGMAYHDRKALWLFYFDPRIGLFFFESGFRGATAPDFPAVSSIVSAVILAIVGAGLLVEKVSVLGYLITEIVMTLPNLLFFAWITIANPSPAHGFSVGELFFPVIVFVAASGFPIWLGLRVQLSTRQANKTLQPSSRAPL